MREEAKPRLEVVWKKNKSHRQNAAILALAYNVSPVLDIRLLLTQDSLHIHLLHLLLLLLSYSYLQTFADAGESP